MTTTPPPSDPAPHANAHAHAQTDAHPHAHAHAHAPAKQGALLAILAALLFGLSTPLVQRAGVGVGAFTTAALLYAGAALAGLAWVRSPAREAALRRSDLPRLGAMALFGAVVGPVALAWGLQRTGGTAASLMLALEAVFTVLLARLFYREALDGRVRLAVLALAAGALLLVVDRGVAGGVQGAGLLAVLAATLAWGLDNTLSRALAERDPAQVVVVKSALGALASMLLAAFAGESIPAAPSLLALAGIGAVGYGLSLRAYLLSQRSFGAARTGSVFGFAPFIGAAAAVALGDRAFGAATLAGGVAMLAGVWLHVTEQHEHAHAHEPIEHEHAHTHDDGHHDHTHDHTHDATHEPLPAGAHSHLHRHAAVTHTHAHVPDAHHTHVH